MIICNTNTPYYLRELEKNPVNNLWKSMIFQLKFLYQS